MKKLQISKKDAKLNVEVMNMNLLITGFDPFNNETINPAYQAVKILPNKIGEINITKLEIPTSFTESFKTLKMALDKQNYDFVILVGLAGGRAHISLEKVAINYMNATIPDNDGLVVAHQQIANNKEAYFTTLPIIKMLENLNQANIKAAISYTAGTFVCNYLMYKTLEYFENSQTKVGFIHVPFCYEQTINHEKPLPYMELETIAKALEICIKALI